MGPSLLVSASGYKPALDGVRSFAILGVLASHSLGSYASGGGLGVNVFFTLSGFLITGILLQDEQRFGRIDFRRFYWRRALRLLPPLAALLVLVALLPWPFRDNEVVSKSGAIAASGLYVANLVVGLTDQGLGHLSHMWSLAVEEQFYVLWPVALLLLARRRRLTPGVLLGLAGAFAAARIGHELLTGSEAYDGWPTAHADQLLLGAALSVALHRGVRWSPDGRWCAAGASLVAAVVGLVTVTDDGDLAGLGGYTLVGVGTALVLWHVVTEPQGHAARLLSMPLLVGLGKVSYGVYLFHRPLFRMGDYWTVEYGWSAPVRLFVIYSLTAVAVAASWYLIERPALSFKDRAFGVPTRPRSSAGT